MKVGSLESVGSITSLMVGMTLNEPDLDSPRTQLRAENDRLRAILEERVMEVSKLTQQCAMYKHDAERWAFAKQKYHARLGHATAREFQDTLDRTIVAHKDMINQVQTLEKRQK